MRAFIIDAKHSLCLFLTAEQEPKANSAADRATRNCFELFVVPDAGTNRFLGPSTASPTA
jgi:hypothetical protein